MNWAALDTAAAVHGLFVMGALHDGGDTLALIGAGQGMWPVFQASPEFDDGRPHTLDRWSKRILPQLSATQAKAQFPSDGPPYLPFIAWARQTGRFWQSPTGMLVHDTAGLMISIRGALRFAGEHALPVPTTSNPCETCADRPCASACPVNALSASAPYEVPACKAHIGHSGGADCMANGCLSRRACPVSAAFQRDPAQSAFHMQAFLPS